MIAIKDTNNIGQEFQSLIPWIASVDFESSLWHYTMTFQIIGMFLMDENQMGYEHH